MLNYQILAIPGGFSYGDDTGSGRAYANKLNNHLSDALQKFASGDNTVPRTPTPLDHGVADFLSVGRNVCSARADRVPLYQVGVEAESSISPG